MKYIQAFFIVAGVSIFCIAGCKDATRAQFSGLGSKHTVTVWSGGVAVRVYHSTGSVSNHNFEDAATHKLVEVSGTVTIEQE